MARDEINGERMHSKASAHPQTVLTSTAIDRAIETIPADKGLRALQAVSAIDIVRAPVLAPRNTENYTAFDDNPVKQVAVAPVSTFSVDVDTAAYSNIRRLIAREGRLPPRQAVRIEEMIREEDNDSSKMADDSCDVIPAITLRLKHDSINEEDESEVIHDAGASNGKPGKIKATTKF